MIDEGQTGGEQMVVISESEYEQLQFAKGVVQFGIPILIFSLIFFVEIKPK